MDQIKCFSNYLKGVFKKEGWWRLFPFALIGMVIALAFYIVASVFMLVDLLRFELKKILYGSNETISGSAQFVKFLMGFPLYFVFSIVSAVLLLPLAILSFLTVCFLFVSSLGRAKGNPYAFHSITNSL